jgi:oligosaccharide reducing-end xylanase
VPLSWKHSTLLGKSEVEVQARIDSIWAHFFTPGDINKYDADGEKCVYNEVGNSMGIIVDTGSNDICWSGRSKPSFIL